MRNRVLLVDDHILVRAGIRSLLEKFPLVEVIAEAGNGREAVELAKKHSPNLVLMDVTMSDLNGLEATKRILKDQPGTRVIILSMHSKEEYVLQALRAGASGYLLKDAAATELRNAIDAVARGETYLSTVLSKRVIDVYLQRGQVEDPADELTSRQKEILQLIAEGKTTKEIACLLKVSVKTVEAHRSQMMDRLNIHDIPGLVRYAIRIGLIESSN